MRRALLIVLAISLGWLGQSHAQSPDVTETLELRVEISPDAAFSTNTYIGGQLVLSVQLISRYPFEALSLELPGFPDAEVVELMRPRTRQVSSYAGQGWVFERAIAITPRVSGVLTIPPVTATGMIEPEEGREVAFDLSSDPKTVKVAGISPQFDDGSDSPWWLVSDRVEIDEVWSVPIDNLHVGETVERRINLRVWGVSADRLPKLEHPRTRGIRVSELSAKTATEKSPAGLIATAEYVWILEAEPRQVAFIAPVGLAYWHPLQHRRMKAAVPGHRIEPLPADSAAIATSLMVEAQSRRDGQKLAFLAVAAVVLAPAVLFLLVLGATFLPSRADLRLRAACRPGATPARAYSAFQDWLRETGFVQQDFDKNANAHHLLSEHLFAPEHPAVAQPEKLATQALALSRKARRTTVFNHCKAILDLGTPFLSFTRTSHR